MRKERVTITREKRDALMQVAAAVRTYIEGETGFGAVQEAMGKLYRAGVKIEDLYEALE